jgi:metal-responsive CopG/Arc/MetJ family transcriptional regulator
MSSIKTAISIDETLFNSVEKLAKKLHISRSMFFTQSARYMLKRDENIELLQKINKAYETPDMVEEKKVRLYERKYSKRKPVDSW